VRGVASLFVAAPHGQHFTGASLLRLITTPLYPRTPRPPDSYAGTPALVAYPLGGGLAFCGGVCILASAGLMSRHKHR
jgi:hypothetical protein